MNCDEYLRKLHENPRSADPDMDDHAGDCEACRQQRDALLAFEERLRGSLQLDADSQLMDRVKNLPAQHAVSRHAGYRPVMLAAIFSAIVITALIGWVGHHDSAMMPAGVLPAVVVAHIDAEPASLQSLQEVPDGLVADLLNNLGAVLAREITGVVYAAPCLIGERPGLHLVVREGEQLVTILMMPGEYVASRELVDAAHYSGTVVPTSYGSLAVVSDDAAAADSVTLRINAAVMWGRS